MRLEQTNLTAQRFGADQVAVKIRIGDPVSNWQDAVVRNDAETARRGEVSQISAPGLAGVLVAIKHGDHELNFLFYCYYFYSRTF